MSLRNASAAPPFRNTKSHFTETAGEYRSCEILLNRAVAVTCFVFIKEHHLQCVDSSSLAILTRDLNFNLSDVRNAPLVRPVLLNLTSTPVILKPPADCVSKMYVFNLHRILRMTLNPLIKTNITYQAKRPNPISNPKNKIANTTVIHQRVMPAPEDRSGPCETHQPIESWARQMYMDSLRARSSHPHHQDEFWHEFREGILHDELQPM